MPKPKFIAETAIVVAALEIVKSLLSLVVGNVNTSSSERIEAMEKILESMKKAIDLEKKIKEKQDALDK